MLTHGPTITLSFCVEEPTACESLHTQPMTEAQRLKAIESYALIAASHPVSTQGVAVESETVRSSPKNQSSLGLSLRLQDTFRNYLRLRDLNQISHPPHSERHRPSRELRQLFAKH